MSTARYAAALARVDPGVGYGRIYHYTADSELLPKQDGALITNLGASSDIVLTLMPAIPGAEVVVQILAPYGVEIRPYGLNSIGDGLPGSGRRLGFRGTYVFGCTVAGTWEVIIRGPVIAIYDITEFGASPNASGAVNSAAVQAAHVAAAAASPPGIVTGPCGDFPMATTVTVMATMVGPGGLGYSGSFGRLRFMPEMTDGSPCIFMEAEAGFVLEKFAIEPAISQPNPNPSGGNVQQCIGLQLGRGCSIITSSTKADPCVISTKYYHFLKDGQRIVTENMVGMTELEGNAYYVTVVSPTSFKISTTLGGAFVDASGFGAAGTKGLVRPYDSGVATKASRGAVRDITVGSCAVNVSIEGWFNEIRLRSQNGTLGYAGHYNNASTMVLQLENNWQGHQMLGCTGSGINIKDEGGVNYGSGQVDLGAPSTIDFCEHLSFAMYGAEGSRQAGGGAWLSVGLVSGCRDIDIPYGFFYEGGGGGVSVALGNVNGYTLPKRVIGGVSTTGSTRGYNGTATLTAGTVDVTIPTQVDANYRVHLTPLADPVGRLYVAEASKTTTQFTITNTTANGIKVDWHVVRN